jgi:hypothetical protein
MRNGACNGERAAAQACACIMRLNLLTDFILTTTFKQLKAG